MSVSNIAPATTAIATIGSENVYCELHMRRLGAVIELRADYVEYVAFTGRYIRETLKIEHADDADDAIEAATDLEWMAAAHLVTMDVRDSWKDPAGWPETVMKILDAAVIADHIASVPAAAE